MKCLTIRQPYASLVAAGVKTPQRALWTTAWRIPERCGKRVHKARLCIRPAGHDGPCSWAFPDGPPRRGGSGSATEESHGRQR